MTLDQCYKAGYANIMKLDADSQSQYLSIVAEVRGVDISIFNNTMALFIPNDDYIVHFFGEEALNSSYGLYNDRVECMWLGCVLLPVFNVVGIIEGFAGFNPLRYAEAHETGDKSLNYYYYSTKEVFAKGRYLYCLPDTFVNAYEDGYALLVDGVFDTLSLAQAGFNTFGFLGSTATEEILAQLRFIKRVILLNDNDAAGLKLYDFLRRRLHNVELFKQGIAKDADDVLKSGNRDKFIAQLKNHIEKGERITGLASF